MMLFPVLESILFNALGCCDNAHQVDLLGIVAAGEVTDGSVESLENRVNNYEPTQSWAIL